MLNNIIILCCIRRSKNSFHFAEHFFTYTEISSIYCYYYTPFKLFLLDPSVWVSCKPGNKVFNILQFFHNFQPVIWRPKPDDGMKSKLMHWNVNETASWLSWKSYQSIVEKNHNYKIWSLKLMGFGIDWGTHTRTKKPQWVCFLYCSIFFHTKMSCSSNIHFCMRIQLPHLYPQLPSILPFTNNNKMPEWKSEAFFSSYHVKKICSIYNWIWWIKQHCIHYFLFVLGEAIIDCHL